VTLFKILKNGYALDEYAIELS